jgi:hypothetical protein
MKRGMSTFPHSARAATNSGVALAEQLPDDQLVGLCRLAVNRPVLASHVPVGVADPSPDELAVLVAEVGRRTVMEWTPQRELDVMGAAEAAEVLGVGQTNLRTVKGLPEPVGKIRASTLWRGAAIRRLAAQRAAQRRSHGAR